MPATGPGKGGACGQVKKIARGRARRLGEKNRGAAVGPKFGGLRLDEKKIEARRKKYFKKTFCQKC